MFRKTETNPQLDLFTAPSTILPKRAQKKYTDEKTDDECMKAIMLVDGKVIDKNSLVTVTVKNG